MDFRKSPANQNHVVSHKKCAFILTTNRLILRISTLVFEYNFCYKIHEIKGTLKNKFEQTHYNAMQKMPGFR
jgi:hypothetical protein